MHFFRTPFSAAFSADHKKHFIKAEASSVVAEGIGPANAPPWRPITLRKPFLIALLLLTAILITTIILLLVISSRYHGILFATDISQLPLARSFAYLYLPTIISVIYGFLWTWLDLDIKRLEPFFQLSRDGGAKADNSILLSYPLEFLITVPFSAFKRGHWNVLVGSITMMLIFWGLTPTQAGIFAVRTITVDTTIDGVQSSAYTPLSQQGNLTSVYAQSVYNIAWLNETLPAFMTKEFVLSPFEPAGDLVSYATNASYTGDTTLYSVDVGCTEARLFNTSGQMTYNGTQGCDFNAPRYRPGGGTDTSKPFDTLYVGYQNQGGFADYYLSSGCPDDKFFHLFFVRWSKSTIEGIKDADNVFGVDPRLAANDTALFCEASYYQQEVQATIALPSKAVISISPAGEKAPLPRDMFNISSFEWAMASGMEQVPTRGEYPTSSFPSQKSRLLDMPLNLDYIPKMAPFAIATLPRPAEDYLVPDVLRQSYESAYRLLFSRQLVDILQDRHNQGSASHGRVEFTTQAVVIIPAFAYAALVILGLISMTTFSVLLSTSKRPNQLRRDPATLGSLMDLVSGDHNTSHAFAEVDSESSDDLKDKIKDQEFALLPVADADHSVVKIRPCAPAHLYADTADTAQGAEKGQCKAGIRPFEMKVVIGSIFLIIQLSAVVTFMVLFILSKTSSGLRLPSQSTFVRQLVENYIPIALATLIEPFWIVLNRLLSLLQPFEELRKSNVPASRSVEVDYSSLPPQLLLVRAFLARHFVLATVCMMALLANVLAVALGGLMNERTMIVASESKLQASYDSVLLSSINGTGTPLNGVLDDNSDGSMTVDPFYRKMSNLTADTPLPPWADNQRAYIQADLSGLNQSSTFRLTTTSIGAQLNCQVLATEGVPRYSMKFSDDASELDIETTLVDDSGTVVNCSNYRNWGRAFSTFNLNTLRDPQPGHMALELSSMLTSRNTTTEHDLFCRQNLVAGWLRADWKLKKGETMPVSSLAAWPKMDLISLNATMLLCRPTLVASKANVQVDSEGRVIETTPEGQSYPGDVTVPSVLGLLAQANRYLIDSGATWHNDSFPSDYNNYLMVKQFPNATQNLNASLPVPKPSQVVETFAKVYQQLFAIFIATKFQHIFTLNSGQVEPISTQVLTPETRIVFSTPAFIIVETILGLYMITTIWFYARRPWRVLPRLPSTIASNIAYFAASRALRDLSKQNAEDTKDTRKSWTWSYGTFLGIDGKAHVGIERDPYVLAPDEDGLPSYSVENLRHCPPGHWG